MRSLAVPPRPQISNGPTPFNRNQKQRESFLSSDYTKNYTINDTMNDTINDTINKLNYRSPR